jgi:hypothetical protein
VRDRHWVVGDIQASSFGADGVPGTGVPHLAELSSVEDDGLSQELSVIWEIEPGAMVLETATLPHPRVDRFDDPGRLDAFLDAVRWGAITSADSRALQAPFRSGITIEDYQLDPVVRALQMPRVNLLIADDVGLGKTIEAGLVVQELLLRHRARTVLVVCPASLTLKWKAEMADRFGLEFRIVDADMLRELRRARGLAANPFKSFPRLIVSVDWLKRPKAMSLLRDVLPPDAHVYPRRFDLLIVDEVHTCAPAGRRTNYATSPLRQAKRAELAREDERLMSFDRLTPAKWGALYSCVRITAEGYRVVSVPPCLTIVNHGEDYQCATGWEDALDACPDMPRARCEYLKKEIRNLIDNPNAYAEMIGEIAVRRPQWL